MTPSTPTGEPKGSGRYAPLTAYLKGLDESSVTVTFDRLAEILGFRLPAAASNHAEWWREGSGHSQTRGWRDAGWSFVRTDRRAQTVTFRRDEPAARRRSRTAARAKPNAAAPRRAASRRAPAAGAGHDAGRVLTSALILVPDSAQMRRGGDPTWRRQTTALALLGDAGVTLGEARRSLAELAGEAAGPDLGGDGNRRAYLPALERYEGPLYGASGLASLRGGDRETMRRCCLVVSGLYGLLTVVEPVREHRLTMEDLLPDGTTVGAWWRAHGLPEVLRAHVAGSGVTDVYCFLPAEHVEALGGLDLEGPEVHWPVATQGDDAAQAQSGALVRLLREGG